MANTTTHAISPGSPPNPRKWWQLGIENCWPNILKQELGTGLPPSLQVSSTGDLMSHGRGTLVDQVMLGL